jgi:LPS-assembly protein
MAGWSLRVLALSLPLLLSTTAIAAPPPVKNFFPPKANPKVGQSPPVNPRAPFLLRADEITYDQDMDIATATGNVEISQGDRVLLADTVSYNRRSQVVTASGNVTLMEPSGEVVFGDYMELEDDLRDGVINNIKVLLTDNSRIAAAAGQRSEDSRKDFVRGVFSPCNLCATDPTRAPLWQLKGVRMTHDEVDREITFEDATLELFGVPVFYSPYFSTPDPTVRRRSGFLNPSVGYATTVGAWYGQPYYGVLSENADFTFEPRYFTGTGASAFFGGEFREKFDNATLRLAGSTAEGPRISGGAPVNGTSSWRGNIAGEGRAEFNDDWRGGFDLNRATDRTYQSKFHVNTTYHALGRYDLPNFRVSDLYTEGFKGDNYAQVSAYAFQDNVGGSVAQQIPKALPYANYTYVSQRDELGGYVKVDTSPMVIARQQVPQNTNLSTNSDRLATFTGYYLPYTDARGDVWTFSGTLEADGYYVRDSFDPTTGKSFTGATGRAHPQVAANWRYPLVKQVDTISYLIEPQADVVVGPNGDNPRHIPNEDAQAFEFDDTNLFSLRRFSGYDRLAGGQRTDYGVTAGAFGQSGGSTSGFIGQSISAHGDSAAFSPNSGLQDRISDLVGRVTVNPRKNIDLSYRFRLDHNNFTTNRDELAAGINVGPRSSVGVGYIHFAKPVLDVSAGRTEQVAASTFIALNDFWSAYSAYAYDLVRQESRIGRIGAFYRDECFAILISLDETFQADRDIQKGFSVLLRFGFKYLGDFGG